MTPLHVVPNVESFFPLLSEGSIMYAQANHTEPERVELLAAIMLRETHAGRAPGYLPRGSPDGTGDWTVRTGHWCKRMGVKTMPDTEGSRAVLHTAGWHIPKDAKGQTVPGPYAIPLDGRGWGRGLFQLDALGDQRDLIVPPPWPVERQAAAACAQLALARQQLLDAHVSPTHPLFEIAVICRYNTSLERVLAGIDAGNPNIGTSGGDYGRDVDQLRAAVAIRWPDRFMRKEEVT